MNGSIRQHDNGTWSFVVDVGRGATRKQVRRRGFRTKKDAAKAMRDVLASVDRGTYVARSKTTFGIYLEQWLAGLPTQGREATTIADYTNKIRADVIPALGDVELQQLSALDLDGLYASLLTSGRKRPGAGGAGLSPRTVRYIHTVIGKALADATDKGFVVQNVARKASPPSVSATRAAEKGIWTPAELARFLEHISDDEHAAAWRVAAMTGVRRSELCGIQWADVDLDAATIQIRKKRTEAGGRIVVGRPKTPRSRRRVDLDAGTVAALRAYRRRQLEQRLVLGAGWPDTDYVFTNAVGEPVRPEVLTRRFTALVASAGLPPIGMHGLRHTHASHLLAAGINPKVVSDRLGHASVAFTLDVYAHVMPGQQSLAAQAAAALVDSVTNL